MDFCRFTTDRLLVEGLFWKDVEILVNQYGKLKNTRKVNKVKFQDDENRYDIHSCGTLYTTLTKSVKTSQGKYSSNKSFYNCGLWDSDPWR
ncbi:hypothetical protein LXL04_035000 [Taraxacum kok-saghyz]